MNDLFSSEFQKLTGKAPFPWQKALYDLWFSQGKIPSSCHIPTGLGKTSVIAVWLIALAQGHKVPRRLVYVVNRRTVVDQTTEEVIKYRDNLPKGIDKLAISTLRGQFADNREWSADPSSPAIICGTVDMIGSRLLFCGYGLGFKSKPLHAGFLGQDTLIVHDEAHLEPAFQKLIESIACEQKKFAEILPLQVMELTATSRSGTQTFSLTPDDNQNEIIRKRIQATKKLVLVAEEEKMIPEKIADIAKTYSSQRSAILIFVRKVGDVNKIVDKLPKGKTIQLTGTMRGWERDKLIEHPIFQRFLPNSSNQGETVYLICTSAGEVGVNISADHMICDLSTFDSMAQRFGRVNRFGNHSESTITVVHPIEFESGDDENLYEIRRKRTLALLNELNGSANPQRLGELDAQKRLEAFAPTPKILETSGILYDRWAMTTIQDDLPGRPDPEPYLHGIAEENLPETVVVWRQEVEELPRLLGEDIDTEQLQEKILELLEEYPLKPHELLKDISSRVFEWIKKIVTNKPDSPIWVLTHTGELTITNLTDLFDKDKEGIYYKTLIVPPSLGGLSPEGLLDAKEQAPAQDVADELYSPSDSIRQRIRVWSETDVPQGMKVVLEFQERLSEDIDQTVEIEPRTWYWCTLPNYTYIPSAKSRRIYSLEDHLRDAQEIATEFTRRLNLPENIKKAVILASQYHDLGKARKLWQRNIGNSQYPETKAWAKSNRRIAKQENHHYRHEFGSLLDVQNQADFKALDHEMQELVLHLIAAHHGRGRPHFPEQEAYDPETRLDLTQLILSIPRRFAKLQKKYGRWGLAYLESLVRATDIRASQLAEKESQS